MKFFVAFSALIAVASAGQLFYAPGPLLARAAFQPAVQQQYHAQDEFGQYSYGYSEPQSAKQEVKTLDGVTRGSYSYVDAEGKLQTVDYIADDGGFRVSATNLPKPVEAPEIKPAEAPMPVAETPEVAAARSAHLAAIEEAKAREVNAAAPTPVPVPAQASAPAPTPAPAQPEFNPRDLPQQVEDTPEVAQAKKEHFNAVENAKLRNAIIKEANEVSAAPVFAAPAIAAPLIAAPAPLRYINSAPAPLAIPFSQAILPSGFAYSYGLNNGAIFPASRFLSSQIIHQ